MVEQVLMPTEESVFRIIPHYLGKKSFGRILIILGRISIILGISQELVFRIIQDNVYSVQELTSNSTSKVLVPTDPFDRCSGPPEQIFVNPFLCGISALQWRELQALACSNQDDPESALRQALVSFQPGAICFLTLEQLGAVADMLEEMELTLSFEVSSWLLGDAMLRASRANGFRSR